MSSISCVRVRDERTSQFVIFASRLRNSSITRSTYRVHLPVEGKCLRNRFPGSPQRQNGFQEKVCPDISDDAEYRTREITHGTLRCLLHQLRDGDLQRLRQPVRLK